MTKDLNEIKKLSKLIESSQSFSEEEKVYYKKHFYENPEKIELGINMLSEEHKNREKIGEDYAVGIIRSISDYLEYCKVFDKRLSQNQQEDLKRILQNIRNQEKSEAESENIDRLLNSL